MAWCQDFQGWWCFSVAESGLKTGRITLFFLLEAHSSRSIICGPFTQLLINGYLWVIVLIWLGGKEWAKWLLVQGYINILVLGKRIIRWIFSFQEHGLVDHLITHNLLRAIILILEFFHLLFRTIVVLWNSREVGQGGRVRDHVGVWIQSHLLHYDFDFTALVI